MFKLVIIFIALSGLFLAPLGTQNAFAGAPLPESCFADEVITFDPEFGGALPVSTIFMDPLDALGPPDFVTNRDATSLNDGGLLELEFVDNVLTNSGDTSFDLIVFEIGREIEITFVSIRPDAATALLLGAGFDLGVPGFPATIGDGFYEVEKVLGSKDGVDIDSFFPAPAGTYVFDAVQLIDDPGMDLGVGLVTFGADIDAVCGIDSSPRGGGGDLYPNPNLGDPKHGEGHDNGFCHFSNCLNVRERLTHFDETIVDSGSTQVFTLLVSCPRGANTCNHIELGGGLPGSDVYDNRWSATVDREGVTDNWILTVYNPFGEIVAEEVVVTVQTVDLTFVTATFNIPVLIPGSFGTLDGVGDPHENNRHIHVTVWDNRGGASNYIFNEGIFVDDIYAYPQVEASFDESLEYDNICVNENINKRYSCTFDKVKEWTIKNAEKTLSEMS